MQKIREQVLVHRDKVYKHTEEEVRKRWHFEDAVSQTSCPSADLWCFSAFIHLASFCVFARMKPISQSLIL